MGGNMIENEEKIKKRKNIRTQHGNMKKINLIYIVSAAHSGSTLLDLILGSQQEIESVGEIVFLKNYVDENKKCTCKKNFNECIYWKTIIKKYKKYMKSSEIELYNLTACDSKKRRFLFYMFNEISLLWAPEEIEKYGLKNYYLFKSILEYSDKKIILDSSKDLLRVLKLYLSGLFNIKILYLFRDGRANVESIKRKAKDPTREKENYYGVFIHTLQFIFGHLAKLRIINKFFKEEDILYINYKDFSLYPKKVLEKVGDYIGIEFNNETLDPGSQKYFSSITHHNIGGNRLRFQFINQIKYMNKWDKGLNLCEKLLFAFLGGLCINKLFDNKVKNQYH